MSSKKVLKLASLAARQGFRARAVAVDIRFGSKAGARGGATKRQRFVEECHRIIPADRIPRHLLRGCFVGFVRQYSSV